MATPPRRILPGTTYLVTRRCSERRLFLRPSKLTNEIFLYVLALAAQRCGVLVHAACVLSNHCHLVLTDPKGTLPAFMQYLDSLVARAVNASLGRFEGFWAKDGSYSAVEPLAPADVVDKVAYVLANPVAGALVAHAAEWPGVWTSPSQIGSVKLLCRKPDFFFDPKGYLPETVELELTVPPGFASAEEFRSLLAAALRKLEEKHRGEVTRNGGRFLGVARVKAQNPLAQPRSFVPRFGLKPRIASRDKWRRVEALQRLKGFLAAYREAWKAWTAGDRAVVFPPGTYLMRILHGAQCAGAA